MTSSKKKLGIRRLTLRNLADAHGGANGGTLPSPTETCPPPPPPLSQGAVLCHH